MKRALILGCSHASGHEMNLEPGLNISPYSKDGYGYANSYPVIIAEMLGYVPNNRAIPGGSNDAMFRIWNEVKDTLDNTDIVIACWTSGVRTEIWNKQSHGWLGLAPGAPFINIDEYDAYFKQWLTYHTHPQTGYYSKLKNIIALNTMAEIRGIKVINIDSFNRIPESHNQFYWPVKDNDFLKWARHNNYPHTKVLHFFKPAHQAFAELVVKSIV